MLVKESAGYVRIPIVRYKGSDGEVSVKYKTIDKSAISGRDYKGGSGTIDFKDMEVSFVNSEGAISTGKLGF